MVKIFVDNDEWYPVYFMVEKKDAFSEELEITKEELIFINKAFNDFEQAQDILRKSNV